MSDRASWWAKKLQQDNPPPTPRQPPVYTPVAQPRPQQQQYPQQQPYQQQQAPAAQPANLSEALAAGDALGGPQTQAIRNRPGCPECGSPNFRASKGNVTSHCFGCGANGRFSHQTG